ncbi:MAG: ABC transporter [Crocinitomicaceae bacterium]|nr:ABC transporter [Crocinitomicaceae bacterium]|tara:strand:+ start:6224 stop:7471 length:1248 start_codon:yes stop_codon:yes gene_type:complete
MKWSKSVLFEQIKVAFHSIKGQALRTTLTIGIIGIGIMALIAMVTATESLKENVKQEFSSLGTNTFTINHKRSGGFQRGRRSTPSEPITYDQSKRLSETLDGTKIIVSSSINVSNTETISRENERTNPNVQVLGIDHQYLSVCGIPLEKGRGFSKTESDEGAPLIIIGTKIVDKLFEEWEDAVGSYILLRGIRYHVVGILKSRGSSFGMSQDNQCLIPIPAVRRQYSDKNRSYTLVCTVPNAENLDEHIDDATGAFRMVRKDLPGEDNSFEISQSNALVDTLLQATSGITAAAIVIGIITLFGAGIGLMNIMLVNVSERTREIGTRKALGASVTAIRAQFLVEVIIIGQLGGAVGIGLGLGLGNIIASYFETPFVIPWVWIAVGVTLCMITSIISGYYPSRKASQLDPIIALGRT